MPSELRVDKVSSTTSPYDPVFSTTGGALSHRNAIINGNFDFWQRGTTFNASASTYHYSADRWTYYNYQQGSTTTVTQQAFTIGQTDVPGEPKYYLRHTLGSSNQEWLFQQRIEDVRTFAGQTATLSLWMKSSSAQTVRLRLHQNFGSGGSSIVYSSTTDCSVTTSWTKFTATITPASVSGKTIGTSSYLSADIGSLGATAVASSSVDIAQVQLELGDNATPFEHRSYAEELARSQRYFQAHPLNGQVCFPYDGSRFYVNIHPFVPMRSRSALTVSKTHTVSRMTTLDVLDYWVHGSGDYANGDHWNDISVNGHSNMETNFVITLRVISSNGGLTDQEPVIVTGVNNTARNGFTNDDGFIHFSSEL